MSRESPDRQAIERAQQALVVEGTKIRQQVVGTDHVKASRCLPELLQPIQALAVSAGCGLAWTRPGLDRKTRSLITIAVLTSMSQDHEIGLHTRGALNNGCTPVEIMEVIHHSGVYSGVPRAINAARFAHQAIEEFEHQHRDTKGEWSVDEDGGPRT